jgi:predicted extracellular nuclease
MKNITKAFLLFITILFSFNQKIFAQTLQSYEHERGDYRFMFYNAENLFDIFNDSTIKDEEFLPEGERFWNITRFTAKLNNITKVITSVGQWEAPEIVGLCEIENRYCLEQLTSNSYLKKNKYQIVHKESPDGRGIDVALLYRKDKFKPIDNEFLRINFPGDDRPTRDILYVKGRTKDKDTLHIFINHWPSRYGGQTISEPKRIFAAELLRKKVDSLFTADKNPLIVIMGDLNDYPDNISLLDGLKANKDFDTIMNEQLYNLSYYLQFKKGEGSMKYKGSWGILDQIILSGALLNNSGNMGTTKDNAHVFNADFLLEIDERNTGTKPFRTYGGMKYLGGYSDHLPVYIDFKLKK